MTGASARLVVFGYDFPHHKTQDLLLSLVAGGRRPLLVVGAPHVALPPAPRGPRLRLRKASAEPPGHLANALGIPYVTAPHTASALTGILTDLRPDLGIIAGARLLPEDLRLLCPGGIINLHPGLLPQSRGLDSWLWDIWQGRPMGVSTHLIDRHVDCGHLLARVPIKIHTDETLPEISERIHRLQLRLVGPAISLATRPRGDCSPLCHHPDRRPAQTRMPAELLAQIPEKLARYPWRKRPEGTNE